MVRKPRNVKNELRDAQALELRKAGANYDQIAKQLGYAHKSGAHHAVKRAFDAAMATRNEMAEEMRELEGARLDAYQLGVYQKAKNGDLRSIEVALKIMDRRAALYGLDAPKRSEVSGVDGGPIQIDQEVHVELSTEQRLERIRYLFESQQAEVARPVLGPGRDLAAEQGTADGRVD